MNDLPAFDPFYFPGQREEIERLDYLRDELRSFRDRGLVSAEAVAAIEAEKVPLRAEIERTATAQGAVMKARDLAKTRPDDALILAEKSRSLAPERIDAWLLSSELLLRLGRPDEAVAVCLEGVAHSHDFLLQTANRIEAQRAKDAQIAEANKARARAVEAASSHEYEAAVEACDIALRHDPLNLVMLNTRIKCLVLLDRLDEAEASCANLLRVRPSEANEWRNRIKDRRDRKPGGDTSKPAPLPEIRFIDKADLLPEWPSPVGDKHSVSSTTWASIASEFLEDHWQKLILSLAVLLIVVSSTVGSAIVLGDRLWMAEGKCLLATAYTLMFAGFGLGLTRWGAVRAGRIMRLTTLILLPVDFALVGELPGLGKSSWASLGVLALDSAVMMALAWRLCRSLGVSGGRGTPLALMALGMVNAITPRSAGFSWGFSAMLARIIQTGFNKEAPGSV